MTSTAVLQMAQWGGRERKGFDRNKYKELGSELHLYDTCTQHIQVDAQEKRLSAHLH